MSPPRQASLASRLTAGCVTLVVLLAAVAAGVGWWWKLRASARERALRPTSVNVPAVVPPDGPAPSGPAAPGRPR